MGLLRKGIKYSWFYQKTLWNTAALFFVFGFLRFSKGALFLDAYSLVTKPFWPGTAQKEWLKEGQNLAQEIRMRLLEEDNSRLRNLLSLQTIAEDNKISAAVISRKANGWWQQLELNKGKNSGIAIGNSVIAPGGLIGIIHSITPTTSRVKLLTAPGSKVGGWIERIKTHGILIGMGTNRAKLFFLDKNLDAVPGDIVTTSPASTLVSPNLPIGVIQLIDKDSNSVPFAIIQFISSPEAIDWVQVLLSS